MGEIADALRRARDEASDGAPKADSAESLTSPAARGQDTDDDGHAPSSDYSRAAELSKDEERPETPSRDTHPATTPELAGTAEPRRDAKPYDVAIPRDHRGNWVARAVVADGEGARAESYRHFAIRVARELERRLAKSVMIVSAVRHEGKTTTACNLALACASMAGGRNTALLDLDLRRPSVARALGIEPRIGFEALLAGDAEIDDVRLRTDLPSLDIYPTAYPLLEPHRELTHPRVAGIFAELERRYDTIVIDTAPLLLVPDAELLFPCVSTAVAVMRSRTSKREAFKKLSGTLPDGKLIGTFVNDARPAPHGEQYSDYGQSSERGRLLKHSGDDGRRA